MSHPLLDIPVHPAAAVFPMLSDDELVDLADDIKANGLLHPIVLDSNGVLIDGRNRLVACRRAGVEPTFTTLNGHEPVAFIIAQNVRRRHLTEGQRAIAIVQAHQTLDFSERSAKSAVSDETGVRGYMLGYADVIIAETPEAVKDIMATPPRKAFSKAYEEARAIRDARARRQRSSEIEQAQLERVKAEDADLYFVVTDGRLSLDEAIGVLDRREQEKFDAWRRTVGYMVDATMMLRTLLDRPPDRILNEWLDGVSEHQKRGPFAERIWSPGGLRAMAAELGGLADEMERRKE